MSRVASVYAEPKSDRKLEELGKSLVKVRIFLQRDTEEKAAPSYSGIAEYHKRRLYQEYVEQKRSINGSGVIIDSSGRVLTSEMPIDEVLLKSIEVETADGLKYQVEREAILLNGPGLILKPQQPLAVRLPSLKLSRSRQIPEVLFGAVMNEIEGEWQVNISPLQPSLVIDKSGMMKEYFLTGTSSPLEIYKLVLGRAGVITGVIPGATLIVDKRGGVWGIALSRRIDLEQEENLWRVRDLLAPSNQISLEEVKNLSESMKKKYQASFCKVKITFRKEKKLPGEAYYNFDFGSQFERMLSGWGGKEMSEMVFYGLVYSPQRIFIPQMITEKLANRVDRICIQQGDKELPGNFGGAFKDFSGFIVELAEGEFSLSAPLQEATLPSLNQLFFALRLEHKFGGKHWKFIPQRQLGWYRGYKNQILPSLLNPVPGGSFFLDSQGQLLGFFATELTGEEELKAFQKERGSINIFWGGMDRVYNFKEMASVIQSPSLHLNPNIVCLSEKEEKRLPWLGVEFTRLTPELAKNMQVEKVTKEGTIGLLTTHVYPNSPAEKLGLRGEDILLKIKIEGEEPLELSALEQYEFKWDFGELGPEREMDVQIGKMQKPWKPRKNYLTLLLKAIGVNKEMVLSYFHEGEIVEQLVEIKLAPEDFSSADKYKDEKLGLTVKSLTYEVRKALNLSDADPGIVVAKVEPGGPVGVARIYPYEIILKVEGKELFSVEDWEKHLQEARKQEKSSISVAIMSWGKIRIADISLETAELKK